MVKDAYDMFFKNISMQFHDDSLVEDAEELAKYGEKRVALENFLENVLANEVTISKEAVTLAEKAFSDAPNDYDIELINELKKTDVT
ncbi:hypothetical protein [Ruminococcus sp.]|jgi:hypothetical protein|uniref:hypothetical protein n=1 Tax=Ruminococcus sp. TaxID=41978 RepID=UPI003967319F